MIKVERQSKICTLLDEQGTISVSAIAASLGVSEMTIRRDLEELASAGVLERVHGGARKPAKTSGVALTHEYTHSEKRTRNASAKAAIARAAAGLIEDGQTVFLGTGTTIEQMVTQLPPYRLRILTNSLSVFNLLSERDDYELCLVGGIYRRRTAAFVGPLAEEAIAGLGVDIAFVGANGVCDGDVTTSNMEEGNFQRLALDKAERRYIVADASKLGKRDFFTFYRLSRTTGIVCDAATDDASRTELAELTQVIVA